MRKIILRKVYYMAFIIGIALFLVGCQNKEDVEGNWLENVSTPSKENTELILRHAIDSEEKINQLRDVVNAVQSNMNATITMNPQGYEHYNAMLENDISRGESPHIIEVIMQDQRPLIERNREHFLDLTDFLEESGLIHSFYSLDAFTIDGRIYGLPVRGITNNLYYNKEVVEELGGVPTTWGEFVEIMKQANRAGYNPMVMDVDGYEYSRLFEGLLSRIVSKDKLFELINGETNWTDDEIIQAFERIKQIAQLEIPLIEPEMEEDHSSLIFDSFVSGDTVFLYSFGYNLEDFKQMDDNIGVMSLPPVARLEDNTPVIHGDFDEGYVFSADISEAEEEKIYEFIEEFWKEAVMSDYNVAYGYLPALRMNAESSDRVFQDILDLTNEAASVYPSISSFIPLHYQIQIQIAVKKVADGEITIMEAVEGLDEYSKEMLKAGIR